ncbi:MAG: hypothetical protein Q7U74_11615, partial [Saprospiraceae bacterium]|nr:hypothetical protein [Saprospiraceae bacterium]
TDRAADYNHLRFEQVNQNGHGHANFLPDSFKYTQSSWVAGVPGGYQVLYIHHLEVDCDHTLNGAIAVLAGLGPCLSKNAGFQAKISSQPWLPQAHNGPSGSTEKRPISPVADDGPKNQMPIQNDPGSDALPQVQVDQVADIFANA